MSKFQDWYSKNADALNEKRRAKYAASAEYRETAKLNSAKSRSRRGVSEPAAPKYMDLDGKSVEVFRISQVEQKAGRSEKTLRLWRAKGYIPESCFVSSHRYYTASQVALIRSLADAIDSSKNAAVEVREAAIGAAVSEIFSKWRM